jgi:hypothetical protein
VLRGRSSARRPWLVDVSVGAANPTDKSAIGADLRVLHRLFLLPRRSSCLKNYLPLMARRS